MEALDVQILSDAFSILSGAMSVWLGLLIVYQLYISFYGYSRHTKRYADHDPQLRFLVLVPAHNEEAVISGIIDNLNRMEYPKELYDFYILADNCTDRTAEVARGLGAKVLAFQKASPDAPTGKPIVLQKALETLAGYERNYDLVMFFDADNLMDTNMFTEVNSQLLDNPQANIVQCYLGAKNSAGLVARFYHMSYTITNRFFQFAKNCRGINCVVGGTGFAVRTSYLYNRGGWHSMSLTEDFELQIETTAAGQTVLWNHYVRIYDEKPTRFRDSFRQRIRWAQGHWFVAFKYTPSIWKAYRAGRIRWAEFVSTFLYMYSLTPCVIIVFQALLTAITQVLMWAGVFPAREAVTLAQWWLQNLPGIIAFFYMFLFLYALSERWDNNVRVPLRAYPGIVLSLLLSSLLVTVTQVIGLFKYRQQNIWVKTAHRINPAPASDAKPKPVRAQTIRVPVRKACAAPVAKHAKPSQRTPDADALPRSLSA